MHQQFPLRLLLDKHDRAFDSCSLFVCIHVGSCPAYSIKFVYGNCCWKWYIPYDYSSVTIHFPSNVTISEPAFQPLSTVVVALTFPARHCGTVDCCLFKIKFVLFCSYMSVSGFLLSAESTIFMYVHFVGDC